MPMHDWTRVGDEEYHDFCIAWIAELRKLMNCGRLPTGHYALSEVQGGEAGSEQNTLVVRRGPEHRVVALIELVSPGMKRNSRRLSLFVQKILNVISSNINVLIVDPFPPGRSDLNGIHGAVWTSLENDEFRLPVDKPLTLASYSVGQTLEAYIEPFSVGQAMIDMPLFVEAHFYLPIPLETAYLSAWDGTADHVRDQLTSSPNDA